MPCLCNLNPCFINRFDPLPKFLSTFVYGNDTTGTGSAAASYSEGSKNPLVLEDNLENRDISNDIKKFLLLAGTGGQKRKRKQGTDSDVVYEKLCTQVIVTAIEPFTEDELINRSVEIEIDRKKYGNPDFPGDMAVMADIADARDRIWSGIFKLIALEVLPDFREKRMNALRMLAKAYPGHAKQRLDELFSCLYLICRVLVKYIPHKDFSADPEKAAGEILDQWIVRQNHQQDETLSETNVILNLLEVLLQEYLHNPKGFADEYRFEPEYSGGVKDEYGRWKNKPDSISFVVPTRDLHSAFQMLKRTRNCEYPYLKVGTLGSRLSDSKEVLTRNGWKYEQKVKTVRGIDYHRFTRQTGEK
ncbi:MAG: hypothetical protein AB7S75_25025 [Desulfococcaceae bacterium]